MTEFYTSVVKYGNNILYRGLKNGRRVKLKVAYSPTLFLASNKKTEWKTLTGDYLEPMKFECIREASDFVNKYEDVSNFKVYGNSSFSYAFIAEEFPGMVEWDMDKLCIDVLDIEVGSENGFPDPYKVTEPITAITLTRVGGKSTVFGCGAYNRIGDEDYFYCVDERQLCKRFLDFWEFNCPDVLTGWNTRYFDIPYLVNRISSLLGDKEAKRLSPWHQIKEKKTFQKTTGKELLSYDLVGIGHLDYIELYKNFAPAGKSQENYRLDTIASTELGETKLSYDEYDNLHQLYRQNYQKFIEYNIQDTLLIIKLDDKLKLLELALTLAYDTKSNYEDVFAQTRMWDALIYNYLIEKHIVIPPKNISEKENVFEGAYVKDPQVGMHEYVASFDLNSLYPHLIMQYSISPENLVERNYIDERKRKIVDELKQRNTK